MTPKISVIVPVYNVEKYLSRCVNSILAQSFLDFELILIDDGSTDESGRICDEYAEKDSRIKVFHKKNGGLSSARNEGIEYARGSYISFVDSDDWVSPDYLEYLFLLIKKYDADVVSAAYALTCNTKIDFLSTEKIKVLNGYSNILQFYLKEDKLNKKNDFSVWIKLYRKELFDKIKFPNGKIYEDNIVNFKILKQCSRYVKSSKIIYAYFQRPKSITKSKLSEKHLALIETSEQMLALAGENKKLIQLCRRKIAMSYFSLLAMYVRYGTDLPDAKISELVDEYKRIKKDFLRMEKSMKIHFVSFFMTKNIYFLRKLYLTINGGGTTVE